MSRIADANFPSGSRRARRAMSPNGRRPRPLRRGASGISPRQGRPVARSIWSAERTRRSRPFSTATAKRPDRSPKVAAKPTTRPDFGAERPSGSSAAPITRASASGSSVAGTVPANMPGCRGLDLVAERIDAALQVFCAVLGGGKLERDLLAEVAGHDRVGEPPRFRGIARYVGDFEDKGLAHAARAPASRKSVEGGLIARGLILGAGPVTAEKNRDLIDNARADAGWSPGRRDGASARPRASKTELSSRSERITWIWLSAVPESSAGGRTEAEVSPACVEGRFGSRITVAVAV